MNYAQAYFQDSNDDLPQLDFRRILEKEILGNTIGRYWNMEGVRCGFKAENGDARAHY